MVKAVLFDVDGTLVDSNDAHARAWVEAFAEAGIRVSYDEVRRAIGMGGDKLMPAVAGLTEDSPEGKPIAKRRQEIFAQKCLPHLRSLPGASDLAKALKAGGYTLVAASSAKEAELEALLKIAGVDDLLDAATSSDDADQSKPDPDIVQAALKRAHARPDEAIMIGDTPYDVKAARSAGVRVIAFRSGGWSDEDLRGAEAVYDDPADLLAHLDDSPLAGRSPR
jgi:HAD superfamily hydrolase (TIGR01509 family)